VFPIERALTGQAPIQMMLCGTVERMRRAEAVLLAHPGVRSGETLSLNRTEYPERDLSIVDILPAGCSKGAAILALAAQRGIAPADVMAIGDNWNDVSMLEIAGWPVLMGNAPAELLVMAPERGWRIAGDCAEQGVAEIVNEAVSMGLVPLGA
jgi:hydroxymethylpyrimidine pyrophosphatase-like HAD family hydrolase